jgi:hypothetical protein
MSATRRKLDMKYTRKLSRRTFLRGAGGVAIAVPFLDEMRSRSVWAAPAAPPVRAFNIFFGGGAPQIFQAQGLVGPLAPLAPLAGKMAFLRGVEGPGGHPAAAGAAFTGANLVNDTTAGGPSVDNEVMRFAYPTGKPPTPIDVQGVGYYYKFLDNPSRWVKSWDQNGHPMGGLVDDPKKLFATFFGAAPGGMPMGAPAPTGPTPDQKLATSILDTVVGQYQFYMSDAGNLSMASRSKISDHLDAVRQLENRITGAALVTQSGGMKSASCSTPAAPGANVYVSAHHNGAANGPTVAATDFVASFKTMADIFAMGAGCDLFRFGFTVACCAGDGFSPTGPYTVAGQQIDFTGVGDTHDTNHAMGDNPTGPSTALTHQGWHTHLFLECCAYVMLQLDKYMDPNGQSILQNSLTMLGTDLGTNHSGKSVFYGVSQANGKFKPGLYDVQGFLQDFLGSVKSAMGLGGTPKMTSFLV